MSETAAAGASAEWTVYGAPAGLTPSFSIEDGQDNVVLAPTTDGIVETADGVYTVTYEAPADEGEFVLLLDLGGGQVAAEQLIVTESPADPINITWRPSLGDVAALLPRRTKDSNGAQPGTFTENTEPTDEQVQTIISLASGHIASRVGETGDLCTPALTSRARGMTALYAAMLVELTFFAEQVGTNRSPYPQLKVLFDDGMKALVEGVAENCGEGGGGESVGGDGTLVSASFGDGTNWGTADW